MCNAVSLNAARGHGLFGGIVLLFSIALMLSACSSEPLAVTSTESAVEQVTAFAPPPVINTQAAPPGPASFSAARPNAVALPATVTPEPTVQAILEDEEPAEPVALPSESPTPRPTYTLPAAPEASEWDHYWLNRPVPDGNGVWTDKAYPYGNTRGGQLRPHHGVEFNVGSGTQVLAAASGTVEFAGSDDTVLQGPHNDFYGNVIVIRHDYLYNNSALFTLYGHLSEIFVGEGDLVNARDVIGLSGATGVADGAHLHFEVRVGENSYNATRNPLLWLHPFTGRAVVAGRIIDSSGILLHEAPVRLRRLDAESAYAATTSYAAGNVNSDDGWKENFAFDDVEAGYYEVSVGSGEDRVVQELWVYPYQTAFLELIVGT